MDEKEVLEGGQSDGLQNSPSSASSSAPGDKSPSQFDPEQLLKQVETLIEKKLQSQKDRRIAKLEETVSQFAPVLERFRGLVPDDKLEGIQRDLELEDLKKRVYGQDQTRVPETRQSEEKPTDEMVKAIDEVMQLPGNDPRVADLKLRHGNDPVAYMREAAKLLANIGVQKESTPAEQPVTTPGAVARQPDNPIAEIEDSRTLYRMAAQKIATNQRGRR